MEIEYEPYHLGTKMRQVLDLNFMNKLRILLIENQFEMLINQIEYNTPPIFDIAKKNDAIVQINLDSNAINILGNIPQNVMNTHNEVIDLFEVMGIDVKFSVSFYELIAVSSVKADISPLKVFENKINWEIEEFKTLNASTTGIKVSTSEIIDETEIFEYTIEPKFLSPTNRYYIRIFLRSKDINKIKELHNNIESLITRSINKLENGVV